MKGLRGFRHAGCVHWKFALILIADGAIMSLIGQLWPNVMGIRCQFASIVLTAVDERASESSKSSAGTGVFSGGRRPPVELQPLQIGWHIVCPRAAHCGALAVGLN